VVAHRRLVDAVGRHHRVELGQPVFGGDEQRQPRGLQAGGQRLVHPRVTHEDGLLTLLEQHHQRLVQTVEGVDRGGVVIGTSALAAPVAHQEAEIAQPVAGLLLAGGDRLLGPPGQRDGGQARRRREALLAARIDHVGVPGGGVHRDAAQRGHTVDDGERPVLASDPAQGRGVAARAGGGLGVDEGQHLGRGPLQRLLDPARIDRLAPLVLDGDHLGAGAAGHVGHPAAEHPVDGDHGPVAGLEEVHDRRLHPGGARRGQRDAGVIGGAHQPLQGGLDVLHQRLELGVEVADGRAGESGEHAGRHVGGTRSHQNPARRLETLHQPSSTASAALRVTFACVTAG